jgi:hypothetical protein
MLTCSSRLFWLKQYFIYNMQLLWCVPVPSKPKYRFDIATLFFCHLKKKREGPFTKAADMLKIRVYCDISTQDPKWNGARVMSTSQVCYVVTFLLQKLCHVVITNYGKLEVVCWSSSKGKVLVPKFTEIIHLAQSLRTCKCTNMRAHMCIL